MYLVYKYLFSVLQIHQIFSTNTFFVSEHFINLWLQPVHREEVIEYHHYHHHWEKEALTFQGCLD